MSHKVHPKVFRIRKITDWDARGFYENNFLGNLREDFQIRSFLRKKLNNMSVERIEIERFPEKLNIIITTARPGLIIGRGGEGVEELKKALFKQLQKKNRKIQAKEIKIDIREIKDMMSSASLIAQSIAQQLERRMPYRRIMKQMMDKVMMGKTVHGIKMEISGRLDGSTIARREYLKKGRLPRQTIRADIDFSQQEAHCSFGVLGVKVWLYKGDIFDD